MPVLTGSRFIFNVSTFPQLFVLTNVLEIFLQKGLTGFIPVRRIQDPYVGSNKSNVVGEFVNRNYLKLDYPRDVFLFKEVSGGLKD